MRFRRRAFTHRLYRLSHENEKHGDGKDIFRHHASGYVSEGLGEEEGGSGKSEQLIRYLIQRCLHVTPVVFGRASRIRAMAPLSLRYTMTISTLSAKLGTL